MSVCVLTILEIQQVAAAASISEGSSSSSSTETTVHGKDSIESPPDCQLMKKTSKLNILGHNSSGKHKFNSNSCSLS